MLSRKLENFIKFRRVVSDLLQKPFGPCLPKSGIFSPFYSPDQMVSKINR